MAVYVDDLRHRPGFKYPTCRMTADTKAELVRFADVIGVPASWRERRTDGGWQYCLARKFRQTAIRAGAMVG